MRGNVLGGGSKNEENTFAGSIKCSTDTRGIFF